MERLDASALMGVPDLRAYEDRLRGWRVQSVQWASRQGTRLGGDRVLHVVLHFPLPDNEFVYAELFVDAPENLLECVPFLEAAAGIGPGLRIKVARDRWPVWREPR